MRKIKLFSLASLSLLLSFNSFCQSHTLPQITPKSPNVAAMEKHVDVPVNLSTGMIKLDIPLFSFKAGDVTIPITLNYANNGLQTDEIPTWVGHGWSLSCGGVISYQQKGLNDLDSRKGLFTTGKSSLDKYFAGTMSEWQKSLFLEDIIHGNIDAEYDLYHYFLPNANGSFYFTSPTQVRTLPKADIDIKIGTEGGFNIKDAEGNNFYFSAVEAISTYNTEEVSPDFNDNSSYYLSKIVSKNGSTVVFKYTSYYIQYNRGASSIFHAGFAGRTGCPGNSYDGNTTITMANYLLPDSIIFPEGYIKFIHSTTPRKDLQTLNTASKVPSLDKIEIYNMNAKKIKTFQLYTSYFGNSARLKLDSLSEIGSTQVAKKWKFDYNGQAWSTYPYIFSKSKDHWGYFNESSSLGTIPSAPYSTFLSYWGTHRSINYANRMSDFSKSVLGTLKAIEYPTGGKSEFTYEPNQIKVKKYDGFLNTFMEIPERILTKETVVGEDAMDGSTKTGSFTVSEGSFYKIRIFYETCSDDFYVNASVGITPSIAGLSWSNDPTYGWWRGDGIVFLYPGIYSYTVSSTDCIPRGGTVADKRYLYAFLDITRSVGGKPEPYEIGGCRISSVKTYSGISADTLTKKYIYDDSLQNINFQQYPEYITKMLYKENETLPLACSDCGDTYRIHDESVKPLVGPVIEYKKVTELTDQNGVQGKTEHNFMVSENKYPSGQPYVTPINTNWRIGNEIEKNIITGGTAKTIQTIKNSYLIDAPTAEQVFGIKVDYSTYCGISTGRAYNISASTISPETFHQTGTTEITRSDTNQLTNSTGYSYTSITHNQPTDIVKTVNNKTIRQKIKYAFDYRNTGRATTTEATSIKNIITNRINAPIEQVNIIEKSGSQFVTGGTVTLYKENGYVIDKVYQLKLNTPIPVGSFKFSAIDSASGTFVKDVRYIPSVIFNKYDAKQNIIEQQIDNDQVHSYIWDYNGLYPIAEGINTDIDNIAYTSFEADGRGGFTGVQNTSIVTPTNSVPTGNKAYQLSTTAPISKAIDASKKYIVSYWSNSGLYSVSGVTSTTLPTTGKDMGVWKYYEHIITGVSNVNISGNGLIDELRVYPQGSTMATYTYEPLIGMTSKCDADNRLLYYEYDDIGRLKWIKDQNKKILYKYDYQQQLNCNAETSRAFTKNDCTEGYKGSTVLYTIPAGKYCANNPTELSAKLNNEFNANGQAYANGNGSCVAIPKIYNTAVSKTFTKNNCTITAEVGGDVVYTVPAGKYFSYSSQDDANAKAKAEIDASGQAYANTNGSCSNVYVRLDCENKSNGVNIYGEGMVTADIVLKFYSDYGCTKPYAIKGSLPVKIKNENICYNTGLGRETSNTSSTGSTPCTGTSIVVARGVTLYYGIYWGAGELDYCNSYYSLQEDTGYKKAWGSL